MDWETPGTHGTSKPLWLWAEVQKRCAHVPEGTLELRPKPTELIASSLMGAEGKQLSGYLEAAGSTSEGIELHRLIILCASMLCWMQN